MNDINVWCLRFFAAVARQGDVTGCLRTGLGPGPARDRKQCIRNANIDSHLQGNTPCGDAD
jgi:hypothetical protein